MPPPLLIDLHQVDPTQVVLSRSQIYERLPQRFEFQVLHSICLLHRDRREVAATAEVGAEDWWVRGHLPGRPVLPGVVMLEMAGQVSAVAANLCGGMEGFFGFGGVNDCRFREAVIPPSHMILLCVISEIRSRRVIARTQGIVDGRMAFEAEITGVAMPT